MNVSSLMREQSISIGATLIAGRRWTAHSIRNLNLRSHLRILARMIECDRGKAAPLLPVLSRIVPIIELRTSLLTQVRRATLNTIPVLIRLAAHHRDWIRDPESWSPDNSLAPRDLLISLIHHLLVRYPQPRFCENAWFIDGPLSHVERDWYVHLAQGGSLRGFPQWVPRLTRRAAHEFFSAPDDFLLREAVRFGQANAILKDSDFSKAIAKSRIGLDFHHDGLWLPLFEKWANGDRSEAEFFLVADFLWALAREKTVREIDLTRRTIDSLVWSASRFFGELATTEFGVEDRRCQVGFVEPADRNHLLERLANRWEPLEGVHPYRVDRFGWHWEIRELTSPAELTEEGRDMAHCVGGYSWYCRRGISSIFSMKSSLIGEANFDREITIEVLRKSRRLIQAKAWRNRLPHHYSRRVLLDWCRQNSIHSGALMRGR